MRKIIGIFLLIGMALSVSAQKYKKLGYSFENTSFHFGDVEQWDNPPATFTFTNKSKKEMLILPIFNENDLEVITPNKAIKPNETVVVKAIYYTAGKGSFNRKFPVYFGNLTEPIYLKISGNIKSLSASAYIQCPMAKPETAKAKIELTGNVAEIDTDIPLHNATIEIVGMNNKKEAILYSNSKGFFGTKLPVGNYFVKVWKEGYVPYSGSIYVGQTSPPLRIRLAPIPENANPILSEKEKKKEEETFAFIDKKEENLPEGEKEKNKSPEKKTIKNAEEKVPHTLTTYKTSEPKETMATKEEKPKTATTTKPTAPNKVSEVEKPKEKEKPTEPKATPQKKENKAKPTTEKEENLPKGEKKTEKKEKPKQEKTNETKPTKEKSTTEPKQKKEPKPKPPKVKEEKPLEEKAKYTLRVLDKKTLEPIANATFLLEEINGKQKPVKNKTDLSGYVQLELPKKDYRLLISADNFISTEVNINPQKEEDIIKVFLNPVSDLFSEAYQQEKEKAKEKQEKLLSEMSFSRANNFSFNQEPKTEEKTTSTPSDKNNLAQKARQQAQVDSLNQYIAELSEKQNTEREKEQKLAQKARQQAKVDSLNQYIAQLTQKQNAEREKEQKLAQKARQQAQVDSLNQYIAELSEKQNTEREKEQKLAQKARQQAKVDSLNQYIAQLTQKQNAEREKEQKLAQNARQQAQVDSLNQYIAQLTQKQNAEREKAKRLTKEKEELAEESKRKQEELNSLQQLIAQQKTPTNEDAFSVENYVANNVLFLIDVSNSMGKEGKMDLLKTAIKNLVQILRPIDRVAIIAYNQRATTILESTNGNEKTEILNAIDSLKTSGLTNGVRGLNSAYEMLSYYFIPEGNNQIILATDGLFSKYNNEMTENELNRLVRKQAEKEQKLSVIGFGKEDDGKELMQKLAKNGTGQFIQIKSEWMAKNILIKEIKLNSAKP